MSGLRLPFESDEFPCPLRIFDHHDGVRARWHRRTRHDLHTSSLRQRFGDGVPRLNFPGALERCARLDLLRTHGVAVTRGAVKRRILAIRLDSLC